MNLLAPDYLGLWLSVGAVFAVLVVVGLVLLFVACRYLRRILAVLEKNRQPGKAVGR